MSFELTVVNEHLHFPAVSLMDTSPAVYVHIAAELDTRPAFLPSSRRKKRVVRRCKEQAARLQAECPGVTVSVFKAILIPPGRGQFIERRADVVHIARFDLAVLIECDCRASAEAVQTHLAFRELVSGISRNASFVHHIAATNARRIGPVDHTRQGVFLFNYFFADSVERNLAVWNHTAGWFQAETGLDNSTVLLPVDPAHSRYSIINHCRWDSLRRIVPSLVFKRSFRSFVLANFAANDVAAMPILYRLA